MHSVCPIVCALASVVWWHTRVKAHLCVYARVCIGEDERCHTACQCCMMAVKFGAKWLVYDVTQIDGDLDSLAFLIFLFLFLLCLFLFLFFLFYSFSCSVLFERIRAWPSSDLYYSLTWSFLFLIHWISPQFYCSWWVDLLYISFS